MISATQDNQYPIISSYKYRGCIIEVNHDNGFPLYTAFRQNQNGRNQILTTWGFRDPLGICDPAYENYCASIIIMLSIDHIQNAIDRIIANETYTALSDKTGKEYRRLMEAARGDVNRDKLWAEACKITGFENTRKS